MCLVLHDRRANSSMSSDIVNMTCQAITVNNDSNIEHTKQKYTNQSNIFIGLWVCILLPILPLKWSSGFYTMGWGSTFHRPQKHSCAIFRGNRRTKLYILFLLLDSPKNDFWPPSGWNFQKRIFSRNFSPPPPSFPVQIFVAIGEQSFWPYFLLFYTPKTDHWSHFCPPCGENFRKPIFHWIFRTKELSCRIFV